MEIKDAVEYKGYLGNLEKAVDFLITARQRGENIYFDFNGHRLYSANITIDSAYLEVVGKTYDEFKEEEEKWLEEFEKKEKAKRQAAQEKIPYWIEEGKKHIPAGLWGEWERCVNIRANDLYNGMELDAFLDIVKAIEDGTAKTENDVEKILDDQGHSGSSYGIMKSMLSSFSEGYCKIFKVETCQEKLQKQEKIEQEKQEKISYYQEEGKKYIDESLWEEWNKRVEKSVNNLHEGIEIKYFLEIENEIAEGKIKTQEDLDEKFANPDFDPYGLVEGLLNKYSKDYSKLPIDIENE